MTDSDRVDALLARVEQLEAHVERLERDRGDGNQVVPSPPSVPVSRRRLLGMAGAAAAGAAGAAIATASPAAAATGNMQYGDDNDATTDDTTLTSTHTLVTMKISNTGTGSGLVGETSSTTAIRAGVQGDALAGTGTTYGVHGTNASTGAASAGVQGDSGALTGSTFGVRGVSLSSTGVGVFGGSMTGVSGRGLAGAGVTGLSDTGSSLEAQAPTLPNSGGAHLSLLAGGIAGAPTAGAHTRGDFFLDSNGVLFQCVTTGAPGTWIRQTPLVTLASPVRVYDSRAGKPNQAPNVQGVLSFTAPPPSANNRVIRVSKDASTGTTAIPTGARTLLLNVTAIAVSGVGALSVYADGATQPATSNLNWTGAGQVVANSVTTACNSFQDIRVAVPASAGASANFIVDVFGYYL